MKPPFHLILNLSLGALLSASLNAQGLGSESIVGHVLPSQGERVLPSANMIVVRVQRPGTSQVWTVTVREGGRFDISGLSRGHYEITVDCPGYLTGRSTFVLNPVGAANSTQVYVNLGPREPGESPAGGTVAVGTLKVPETAVAELKKAAGENENGDHEKAVEYLLRAIEIYPEYVEAHNYLTGQYLAIQPPRVDEAIEVAERSKKLQPEHNPVPYRYLGLIHLQRKEFQEAADELQASIDQDPSHAPTAFSLGRAYTTLQRPEDAVIAFELAVEHAPDNSLHRFALGYAYFQVERYSEATRELKRMLETETEGARADMARRLLDQMASMPE